jgi:inner membrane protein
MSPVTHFLLGWAVASATPLSPRGRLLVTVAGVIPDVDALGLGAEILTKNTAHPLLWWTDYHHTVGHNLWFGLLGAAVAAWLCRPQAARVALLFLASFHLHLLGDIVGARGPDGIWSITYLWPYRQDWVWAWQGQWKLNSWPNLLLTAALIFHALRHAWRHGVSPLEFISVKTSKVLVQTLRQRFGSVS